MADLERSRRGRYTWTFRHPAKRSPRRGAELFRYGRFKLLYAPEYVLTLAEREYIICQNSTVVARLVACRAEVEHRAQSLSVQGASYCRRHLDW